MLLELTNKMPTYEGEMSAKASLTLDNIGDDGWLDDEVVDRYMSLITQRQLSAGEGKTVGYMSSQFFAYWKSEGFPAVEGWTTPEFHPFSRDMYFFPAQLDAEQHWILVVCSRQSTIVTCPFSTLFGW